MNQCNNGTCENNGLCKCNPGYFDSDCTVKTKQLSPNYTDNLTLIGNQWEYYEFKR